MHHVRSEDILVSYSNQLINFIDEETEIRREKEPS